MLISEKTIYSLFLGFFALFILRVEADTVNVAGTQLFLPAPESFYEIRRDVDPEIFSLYNKAALPQYTLLAVFMHSKYLEKHYQQYPEARTYILVKIDKLVEPGFIQVSEFKELEAVYSKSMEPYMQSQQYEQEVAALIDKQTAKLNSDFDMSVNVKNQSILPLGKFFSNSSTFSFGTYQAFKAGFNSKETTTLKQVFSTNLVLIKGKLLTVYIYKGYGDKSDIDWLKTFSRKWIQDIVSQNN